MQFNPTPGKIIGAIFTGIALYYLLFDLIFVPGTRSYSEFREMYVPSYMEDTVFPVERRSMELEQPRTAFIDGVLYNRHKAPDSYMPDECYFMLFYMFAPIAHDSLAESQGKYSSDYLCNATSTASNYADKGSIVTYKVYGNKDHVSQLRLDMGVAKEHDVQWNQAFLSKISNFLFGQLYFSELPATVLDSVRYNQPGEWDYTQGKIRYDVTYGGQDFRGKPLSHMASFVLELNEKNPADQ